MRLNRAWFAVVAALFCGGGAWCFGGCSTSSNASPGDDGGSESGSVGDAGEDSGNPGDAATNDEASASDAGLDSPATVTGMAIVSTNGALQAAPGDAVPLAVVFTMSDGTTQSLPAGMPVSWVAPQTVVAQDPNDAGDDSVIPDAGDRPNAFYVRNDYRKTNVGVLYVISAGTTADAGVTVTASLPDGGLLSAVVTILPAPIGDPDAGGYLFQQWYSCSDCHGSTGGGSMPVLLSDGGVELLDGGPVYNLNGDQVPYPAPGLNNAPASGNVANDPAWNAALLGMAVQADIDNAGVALRAPMPNKQGATAPSQKPVGAQDFANVYSWLRLQTQ